MNPSDKVECPVCLEEFSTDVIESHANSCLEGRSGRPGPGPSKPNDADSTQQDNVYPLFKKMKYDQSFSPPNNSSSQRYTRVKSSDKSPVPVSSSGSKFTSPRHNENKSKHEGEGDTDKISSEDITTNPLSQTQNNTSNTLTPLPERIRPKDLTEFVGQEHVMQRNGLFRNLLTGFGIPSLIFWGPPGCGKTTLARMIGKFNKASSNFLTLSATNSGTNEMREVIQKAKTAKSLANKKTILFIDEIHHYKKPQQDVLLPYIENGTIILIGATTENPSFSLLSALLSRCQVVPLEKLSNNAIHSILNRAFDDMNVTIIPEGSSVENSSLEDGKVLIEEAAVTYLANMSDGDARCALNKFEMAVQSVRISSNADRTENLPVVTIEHIKEALQRTHVLYDKTGDEHYTFISALIKSVRGSDANAALYWMARMLEGGEDPLYISRRMMIFASEDIGLADPLALPQAVAAHQTCQFVGKPECGVVLAQCVIYLCRAPKSKEVEDAFIKVKKFIQEQPGPLPSVPLHLRNATTKLMKDLGYGKKNATNKQKFLPDGMEDVDFFS